jgi:hypothetical protein
VSERNGDWPYGWELVTIGDVIIPKVEQGAPNIHFTYIDIGGINNQTKQIESTKDFAARSTSKAERSNMFRLTTFSFQ